MIAISLNLSRYEFALSAGLRALFSEFSYRRTFAMLMSTVDHKPYIYHKHRVSECYSMAFLIHIENPAVWFAGKIISPLLSSADHFIDPPGGEAGQYIDC